VKGQFQTCPGLYGKFLIKRASKLPLQSELSSSCRNNNDELELMHACSNLFHERKRQAGLNVGAFFKGMPGSRQQDHQMDQNLYIHAATSISWSLSRYQVDANKALKDWACKLASEPCKDWAHKLASNMASAYTKRRYMQASARSPLATTNSSWQAIQCIWTTRSPPASRSWRNPRLIPAHFLTNKRLCHFFGVMIVPMPFFWFLDFIVVPFFVL